MRDRTGGAFVALLALSVGSHQQPVSSVILGEFVGQCAAVTATHSV